LEDPWCGNCIAIGSAAVSLEPSAATGLHTVCRHIERLIGCWPGHASQATEAEIAFYNRRTVMEADRMRDFAQLPYLLNERREPFWRAAAAGPVSAELTRDLALFRERGRLATHDEDGFERDEWIASLIGFGLRPRHLDALAQELPMTRIQQRLEAIRL
jgi:tryptophan halogenase